VKMSETLSPAHLRHIAVATAALAFVFLAAIPAYALKIQQVRSPGGITAWLVEDYTVPIISMKFSFDGGTTQDPAGKEGLANLMTGLFDEGAGNLDSDTFQNKLDIAAADMGFSADRDRITGSIRMLTDHEDDAFKLLALAVNNPLFDQGPVDRIREQIIAGIKASEKRPGEIAGRKWREALYGSHPYARPEEGKPETLQAITPDDLHKMHRDIFARSNLKIAVVGAIGAEKLAQILDEVFGSLPQNPNLHPVLKASMKLGQVVDVQAEQPQTRIQLAYPGVFRSDPRFFATYLMNNILAAERFPRGFFKRSGKSAASFTVSGPTWRRTNTHRHWVSARRHGPTARQKPFPSFAMWLPKWHPTAECGGTQGGKKLCAGFLRDR